MFFEVVSADIKRKKMLATSSASIKARMMSLPISLQRLDIVDSADVPRGVVIPEDSVFLVYDGMPSTVDFLSLASWDSLRQLNSWSRRPAPAPGLIAIGDSGPMSPARNWRNGQTPCIFLLEMLAASGWPVGTPPLHALS